MGLPSPYFFFFLVSKKSSKAGRLCGEKIFWNGLAETASNEQEKEVYDAAPLIVTVPTARLFHGTARQIGRVVLRGILPQGAGRMLIMETFSLVERHTPKAYK